MVRQEYLESLVSSESTDETLGAKAVIRFIDEFLGTIKDNLIAQHESNKSDSEGTTSNADQYMRVSEDFTDDLTH